MSGIELRRSFRPWGGHECLPSPLGWADILSALWAFFHPDLEGMFGIELRRAFRPEEVMSTYPARWAGLTYFRRFAPQFPYPRNEGSN